MDAARHELICDIFLSACELESKDRSQYLDSRCGKDTQLRIEVEALLAADEKDIAFSAIDTLSELEPEPEATQDPQIAEYRILSVLGHGGMGVVFKAEAQSPRRTVALKVIRTGVASARALRHFDREAGALARLQHPGIAQIFDARTSGRVGTEQRPYFAMEYVEGPPLLAYAEENGLDRDARVALFIRICDAVHHAHLRGVVHRDLKPANILVDGSGQPKILDFGIAVVTGNETETLTIDQAPRGLVGTIPYMSPEQAAGRHAELDARSDLYSLGVILYELLTHRLPYPVKEAGILEAVRVIQEVPPAPFEGPHRKLRGDLEIIVRTALRKDRSERYQSVSELAADLRRYQASQPIQARRPSTLYQLRKLAARHKTAVLSLAMVVLTLIVALSVSLKLYFQAERAWASNSRSLERVLRLSDAKVLGDLLLTARSDLWPRHPDRIAGMEKWLVAADALIRRLPDHRQSLARLEREPGNPSSQNPEAFSESVEWQRGILSELVRGLEEFGQPGGVHEDVLQRLSVAREIEQVTRTDAAERWLDACDQILLHSRYQELELSPQLGLIPLGMDPDTELYEFWLWESGCEPPRDADGHVVMTDDAGLVLVLLPAGEFWMGSSPRGSGGVNQDPHYHSSEGPPHRVPIPPFFLSKFEMTQGQWLRLTRRNPSICQAGERRLDHQVTLSHPVENLSWFDADQAMRHLGLELPSEEQWEYAARADRPGTRYFGDRSEALASHVNLVDRSAVSAGLPAGTIPEQWVDGFGTTCPVGSFPSNPFGLHEILGNVAEWCSSVYDAYPGASTLEHAETPYRTYRGGSYLDPQRNVRSACRAYASPDVTLHIVGVRPARAIQDG